MPAYRRRVRRGRLVPAAAVHRREAVRPGRRGVGRRTAIVVPPVAGNLADLGDRHRARRLTRPGERAQADGRRVGQPAGPVGEADTGAAQAADGLRRRSRLRGGLQRAAGRRAVHRGDHDGRRHAADRVAGAGLFGCRVADRVAVPAGPRDVPGHSRVPVLRRAAGVLTARGPGDRPPRIRIYPSYRVGDALSGPGLGVDAGDDRYLRAARPAWFRVSAAVR